MNVEGQYTVPGPRERVWALLLDPEGLRKCLPGCERMDVVGENQYEATLKIGLAAVSGTYVGKVQITDIRPPNGYTMAVEGSGKPGFVKGRATLDLEEQGGNTLVKLAGEAQVGGLIAAVGQRMLGGAAKMMMGQFFKRLSDELASA
jgi:carbon monoxide dehydrogenase subunit G